MRRTLLMALAVMANGAIAADPLRAGIYNLHPPSSAYPSEYVQATAKNPATARVYLLEVQSIRDLPANAPKREASSLRKGYERQLAELEAKQRDGKLSPEERVDRGACLLRMGRIPQATAALEEAQRTTPADAPYRCFLLANLASAYQENEDLLPRALDTQSQALKLWPTQWPGWKRGEGLWYRRVETYALKLMQLRQAEQRLSRGRPGEYTSVDALFPRVRYIGPGGRYQAGGIDFAQWNELPFDAESIVVQLVFWRPFDDRLYWQYGELLNAGGRVDFAYKILDYLYVVRLQRQAELQEHYRILKAAKSMQSSRLSDWGTWIGGSREERKPTAAASEPAPVASSAALPDWRTLAVSFATGIIVAVLAMLQWRQWRPRPK